MNAPVLLFDGLCTLCDGTVSFVLGRDRSGRIRFAPLQGAFAAGVVKRHPDLTGVDSLVLVESREDGGERVRVRSDAALRLAVLMGGPWRLLAAFRIVPRAVRDAVYDWVARNRHRWFGRRETCRLPTPDERARFLD